MAEKLEKTEVLKRRILDYPDRPQDIRVQGVWGDNIFTDDDGGRWYPVTYHGQRFRRKLGKSSRQQG